MTIEGLNRKLRLGDQGLKQILITLRVWIEGLGGEGRGGFSFLF